MQGKTHSSEEIIRILRQADGGSSLSHVGKDDGPLCFAFILILSKY